MSDPSKCAVTHPQIARGACPRCGLLINEEPIETDAEPSNVRWNLARMLDDLDQADEAARLTTIFNLSDHLPSLDEAMPVIRKAFYDQAEKVRDRALTAAVRLSDRIPESTLVETCESLLRQDPYDLAALNVLLYFYMTARSNERYCRSRRTLILRLIEEMPDAPSSMQVPMKLDPERDGDIYAKAKALWVEQVRKNPDNLRILENASFFFYFTDKAMAGKLLRRWKEIEPGNPHWSYRLGSLYSFYRDPEQPESGKDWALMSLAELEAAYHSEPESHKRYLALMRLPEVALRAHQIEKARHYAETLHAESPSQDHVSSQIRGDREAKKVLGWQALCRKQFEEAKTLLFSA